MSDYERRNRVIQSKQEAEMRRRKRSVDANLRLEEEDDDDEGGGGLGKRKGKSYKLEGLVKLLGEGKLKAKKFWRFLAQEGLNTTDDIKETALDKGVEKEKKKKGKLAKEEGIQEDHEKVQELSDEALEEDKSKKERKWGKPTDDAQRGQYGFLDTNYDARNADAMRKGIMGDRVPGSIISGTTNPLGFARQREIAGATGADFSQRSLDKGSRSVFQDTVAGSHARKHHADHWGAVFQSLYYKNPHAAADRATLGAQNPSESSNAGVTVEASGKTGFAKFNKGKAG